MNSIKYLVALLLVLVLAFSGCVNNSENTNNVPNSENTNGTQEQNNLNEQPDAQDNEQNNSTNDPRADFLNAINAGQNMSCTYSAQTPEGPQNVKLLVNKNKSLVETTVPEKGVCKTIVDTDTKKAYMWCAQDIMPRETATQLGLDVPAGNIIGSMMSFDGQTDQPETESYEYTTAENYSIDWECNPSTEKIEMPTNVTFVDLQELLQKSMQGYPGYPTP